MGLLRKARIALQLVADRGLLFTLRYALFRSLGGKPEETTLSGAPTNITRVDPLSPFRFVRMPPFYSRPKPTDVTNTNEPSINWLSPSFGIGSGGHLNIFRFCAMLEKVGWNCRIVIVGDHSWKSAEEARLTVVKHFVPIKAAFYLGAQTMPAAQVGIATAWDTAYTLDAWQSCEVKAYFVQDFEPWFFSQSSLAMFAEHTYRMGFLGLTAGDWLAKELSDRYGMQTIPFRFSYDHNHYFWRGDLSPKRRILFYARPPTPRRGFELGLFALEEVKAACPDVEIVMAGWDISGYEVSFAYKNEGTVAVEDLPALYNTCDIALVISLSNLSLLPLELAACGCVVVSNAAESVSWGLPEDMAELAPPTPSALAGACIKLLRDEDYRRRKMKKGLEIVQETSWTREGEKVDRALRDALQESRTQ